MPAERNRSRSLNNNFLVSRFVFRVKFRFCILHFLFRFEFFITHFYLSIRTGNLQKQKINILYKNHYFEVSKNPTSKNLHILNQFPFQLFILQMPFRIARIFLFHVFCKSIFQVNIRLIGEAN